MRLAVKIVLAVIGLLLLLAVGIATAVALIFDPNDYQPLLERSVEQATGRKLTINGDLGLKLFPCCSVTVGQASLGNPPGFPDLGFASVDSAALSLKVWPLIWRRDVEIGAVRLDGLNANLLVRRDGAANWAFESTPAAKEAPGGGAAAPGRLSIAGVEIRKGRVSYRDQQSGADYLAENLEVTTGDITPGEPFDLKFSGKLTDRSDGTTATVSLKSRATLNPDDSRLALEKPKLALTAAGKTIPAERFELTLGAAGLAVQSRRETKFEFDRLEGEFRAPGLKSAGGDAEGSFSAEKASFATGASTELVVPALAADVTLSGKNIPGERIDAKMKAGGVALDLDKMRGAIKKFSADIDGLGAALTLAGGGQVADTGANLSGTMTLEPISPRSVLAVLDEPAPSTADPEALTRLGGTASWALGKNSLRLPKLDFQLDQTKLTGTLGITDFDRPATSFDLALDTIDLDRYLAPEAETESGGAKSTAQSEDIPVETIRKLRLDGRLRIGQLTFAKAKMSDVAATLRAANGTLRLDPLAAKLYGGEYHGAVTIDATGPRARVSTEQQIAALQVGGVLKDMYKNDKLTGALSGRISATGTGNRSDEILKSLSGSVSMNLADGVLLGTDIWHDIRSARARLKGQPPPPAPAEPETKINAMEVAGSIQDGVLRTDKLLAEIPFLRMSGAGGLDLADKTVDYRLQAKVFETPTFADGSTLKDLTGLAIPLTVKGAMDQPKVGVDLQGLATGVVTEKLRERLLKKLGPKEEPPAEGAATDTSASSTAEQAQPAGEKPPAEEAPQEEKPRDALKRALRDLLKPKE